MLQSTKTYDHNLGFSCCFRQWRAKSHCRKQHGYALSFKFVFDCSNVDENTWVVDFGGLKWLKEKLTNDFDHTTLVAQDDPELETFKMLHQKDIIDLRIVPATGCESFAKYIGDFVNQEIRIRTEGRCWLSYVEVREHNANSAIYFPNTGNSQ